MGDIYNLKVNFSFLPVRYNRLLEGISCNTLNFRFLVAVPMRQQLNDNVAVPLDMLLFFSDIYKSFVNSLDRHTMVEYSIYQMFHPVLYDLTDMTNFVHLVVDYRIEKILKRI